MVAYAYPPGNPVPFIPFQDVQNFASYTWVNSLTTSDPKTITIDQNKETSISDTLPGSGQRARATARNDTPTAQEVTVTLSQTISNSVSNTVTTTTAVTSGTAFSASVSVDTPFASLSGTVSGHVDRTNSEETSDTTTKTTDFTFDLSAKITVPAGHTYVAQLMYKQVRATVPYTYNVNLGGSVTYIPSFVTSFSQNQSAGEVAYYDKASRATYPGVNMNELSTSSPGQPPVGYPYNTQQFDASLNIPGMVTFAQGYEAYVLFTDATSNTSVMTTPMDLESGTNIAALSLTDSTTYYAPYDPSTGIGDNITLDEQHTNIVGTPFADDITAGSGNDVIDAGDGNNLVYGGSGTDVIMAEGSGVNTLIGGSGNDYFKLQSTAMGNLVEGGTGTNWIAASAPETSIIGGPQNDTFVLNAQTSGGTEITDHLGLNALTFIGDPPLQFEQDGEGLIILLNGDQSFDSSKDILWTDFFENESNSVNGLRAAYLANLTKDGAYNPSATGVGGHSDAMSVPTPDSVATALLHGWS